MGQQRRYSLAVVRELHQNTKRTANVNTMSELGYKLHGLDPTMRYRQITLVDTKVRPNESFTALIPDHLAQGLKRGVMVAAGMSGCGSGNFSNWVITDISPL